TRALFDHLVSGEEKLIWDLKSERFCGLEIDHEFVLRRQLIRQIGGLFATKKTGDGGGGAAVQGDANRHVSGQTTIFHEFTIRIDRGKAMPRDNGSGLLG